LRHFNRTAIHNLGCNGWGTAAYIFFKGWIFLSNV